MHLQEVTVNPSPCAPRDLSLRQGLQTKRAWYEHRSRSFLVAQDDATGFQVIPNLICLFKVRHLKIKFLRSKASRPLHANVPDVHFHSLCWQPMAAVLLLHGGFYLNVSWPDAESKRQPLSLAILSALATGISVGYQLLNLLHVDGMCWILY